MELGGDQVALGVDTAERNSVLRSSGNSVSGCGFSVEAVDEVEIASRVDSPERGMGLRQGHAVPAHVGIFKELLSSGVRQAFHTPRHDAQAGPRPASSSVQSSSSCRPRQTPRKGRPALANSRSGPASPRCLQRPHGRRPGADTGQHTASASASSPGSPVTTGSTPQVSRALETLRRFPDS